jgi:GTPase KRas protein
MEKEFPEYKIIVMGSGGTGKSCITNRFITGVFTDDYDPTIEDSYSAELTVDGEEGVINVLDSAGQEEYRDMVDQYIRTGQGFIIVYSVIAKDSFEEVWKFRNKILMIKDLDPSESFPLVLVGNKIDLSDKRQVSYEQGEQLAKKINASLFIEASAKENINCIDIFEAVVREIRKDRNIKGYQLKKTKAPDEAMKQKIKKRFARWFQVSKKISNAFSFGTRKISEFFNKKKDNEQSNTQSSINRPSLPITSTDKSSIMNSSPLSQQSQLSSSLQSSQLSSSSQIIKKNEPKDELEKMLNNTISELEKNKKSSIFSKKYPWFYDDLTSTEADNILSNAKPGTFLVRFSSQPKHLAISFVSKDGVQKALVSFDERGFWINQQPEYTFSTLGIY